MSIWKLSAQTVGLLCGHWMPSRPWVPSTVHMILMINQPSPFASVASPKPPFPKQPFRTSLAMLISFGFQSFLPLRRRFSALGNCWKYWLHFTSKVFHLKEGEKSVIKIKRAKAIRDRLCCWWDTSLLVGTVKGKDSAPATLRGNEIHIHSSSM